MKDDVKDDSIEREAAVTEINAVVFPRALASALAIDALILACLWGQWRAFVVGLVLMAVQGFLNGPPTAWLQRRAGTSVGEATRSVVNVATVLCLGHLIDWQLPIWAYVTYFALPMIGLHDRQGPARLLLTVVIIDVVGIASGSGLWAPVVFSLLALSAWGLIDVRTRVIRQLYLNAKAQHDELTALHERVVAQEKLAGLGMLAAGITHEINNPMGYVTSNVSALADDIRRLPSDPILLEEYATDVLPATLNGIERVNAIVNDLRRFARGDLEGAVAFDLNAEVSAALRIARNELKYRCTVDVALGALPRLSGRPQQLAQVIFEPRDQRRPVDAGGPAGAPAGLHAGRRARGVDGREGRWRGNVRGDDAEALSTLLHDQGGRGRHGTGPLGGPRHRQGARRPHRGDLRAGEGKLLHGASAHREPRRDGADPHAAAGAEMGNVNRNVVPRPSSLSTQMRPPWAEMIFSQM